MKSIKSIAIAALSAAVATGVTAQSDLQLPLMYGAQATTANPAILQNHKVTVSLAGVSMGTASPFAVNEVGEVRDGTLFLDGERFIDALAAAKHDPYLSARVESIGFNYSTGRLQAGFSHAVRVDGTFGVPVGLAQLATYGNGRYLGETLEVAPRLNMQAYQEFALHGAYAITQEIAVGARVKYLAGAVALQTDNASLEIYTDPDSYHATVTSDAVFRAAGVPVSFDGVGVDVGGLDNPMGAGSGFGFDIGAVYTPSEDLEIGFSVRDIGSIKWDDASTQEHRSRNSSTYEGYGGDIFDDSGAAGFNVVAVVDSVTAAVEFESAQAAFRTTLPTTVQATGRYVVADRTTVDATVFAAKADTWRSGFGVGVTQAFGKFGQVGVLGGARTGGAFVGANLSVDVFGPQLYVACDNLLTVFNAADGRNAHLRAGLNLAFGAIKRERAVKGFYDTKVEGINQ